MILDKWAIFRKKCPECGSEDIERLNKFRYTWDQKNEQQKFKCNICKHTWWQ